MFPKKIIINILSAIFVIGIITFGVIHLNKPRIDISSDEKMEESTQRLRDSLNDEQKAKYEQAVGYIAFDGLTFNDLMSTDEAIKKIKKKFKNCRLSVLWIHSPIPFSIRLYRDFVRRIFAP